MIFDLGGVVLDSPLHAIARYEAQRQIRVGTINRVVVGSGSQGAWSRLERGELPLEEFYEAFDRECAAAGQAVSSRALMAEIAGASRPRPQMLEAIRRIRARGLLVAALTNNWVGSGDQGASALRPHFDEMMESSVLGLRKPDPQIYRVACARLGITPAEAVFLDDIGANLKPARQLGMTTIKVVETAQALAELEATLGFPLGPG